MERWENRVAVVTGATSGIGAATALELVRAGLRVVALGLQQDALTENGQKLTEDERRRYFPLMCNVGSEADVKSTFEWVEKTFGGTDVLVNIPDDAFVPSDVDTLQQVVRDEMVQKTVTGLILCTREAVRSMRERNFRGHILNVNSVGGRPFCLIDPKNSGKAHPSAQAAFAEMDVTLEDEMALSRGLIRTTIVSPGMVRAEKVISGEEKEDEDLLNTEDVGRAVAFAISTPPYVQFQEVVVKPVAQKI